VVVNKTVEDLVLIIDFHLEGEVLDIRLDEALLELLRFDFRKRVHELVLFLV